MTKTEASKSAAKFGTNLGANKRKAKRMANRCAQSSRRLQRRIGYDADTARNVEWALRKFRYAPAASYIHAATGSAQ